MIRDPMRPSLFVLLGFGCAFLAGAAPTPAPAVEAREEVFTKDHRDRLCSLNPARVEPEDLATFLFGYVDSGVVRDHLEGQSTEEKALHFFSEDNPFNPPVSRIDSDWRKKALTNAQDTKNTIINSLSSFLGNSNGRLQHGYKVERPPGALSGDFVHAYFAGGSGIVIHCVPVPAGQQAKTAKPKSTLSHVRLRGKTEDLAIASSDKGFQKASSARVGFVQNNSQNKQTLEIQGVLGYVFESASDTSFSQYIPYVAFNGTRTAESDKQNEKIAVAKIGFLYDRFQRLSDVPLIDNVQLGLYPVGTFDLEQDAKTFNVKAYAAPGMGVTGFRLGQFNDVLGSAKQGSWLLVRPDFRFLGQASYVFDAGSNIKLKDNDFFAGLGFDAELKLLLATGDSLVDRFSFSAEYRYLHLISGVENNTDRLELGADYRIDADGNFTIGFKYITGEEPDTFQAEEAFRVNLGLKF